MKIYLNILGVGLQTIDFCKQPEQCDFPPEEALTNFVKKIIEQNNGSSARLIFCGNLITTNDQLWHVLNQNHEDDPIHVVCSIKQSSAGTPIQKVALEVQAIAQESPIISQETQISRSHASKVDALAAAQASNPQTVMELFNKQVKDKLLQISNIAHDQALCTIFGALLSGASLSLYDTRQLDAPALRNHIQNNNITVFTSIPSVFRAVFEDTDPYFKAHSLRLIRLGGEAATTDHLKLFNRIADDRCSFGVGYGATECSWIAYFETTKAKAGEFIEGGTIPLGKIAKHILPHEDPVEHNMSELCITSPYLSLGYQDNPKAESAAFFDLNGVRYYRTGDYVQKIGADFQFRGRKNWHVKINGERISLKEIEDTLKQYFPMKDCVVISYGKEDNLRLYAFYIATEGAEIDDSTIRRKIAPHLKPSMIPFGFIPLKELPKLGNQKIDRNAMVAMIDKKLELNEFSDDEFGFVDKILYTILGDSFFKGNENLSLMELGINSLQISKLYHSINAALSNSIPPTSLAIHEIYEAGSIQNLKQIIALKKNQVEQPALQESLNVSTYYLNNVVYMNEKVCLYWRQPGCFKPERARCLRFS